MNCQPKLSKNHAEPMISSASAIDDWIRANARQTESAPDAPPPETPPDRRPSVPRAPDTTPTGEDRQDALRPPRPGRLPDLPAAAAPVGRRSALGTLFLLTLLSTVDGSLVALAAAGRLSTLGGALTAGLTVIAGVGSWVAARDAFATGPRLRSLLPMAVLAAVTLAATVASVWVGLRVGAAIQLHILPKAAGIAVLLVAGEVAGLRVPRLKGIPAPLLAVAGGLAFEGVGRWIPS